MISHPSRDVYGVVQKPERYHNSVRRVDMTRSPYKSMSGCVNLTTPYGYFVV
jgi:hypothetical protein